MIVRITFPDGRIEEVYVPPRVIRGATSLEDIVEYIAEEMADNWLRRVILKKQKPSLAREKYIEGVKKWLYPQLLSALAEKLLTEVKT